MGYTTRVAIFPSAGASEAQAAQRLQARYLAELRAEATIFDPGAAQPQPWGWNAGELVLLHFLCGSTGFDERGVFFLRTGAGAAGRLRVADVVRLLLKDMRMLRVMVVLDGPDSRSRLGTRAPEPGAFDSSRAVASLVASLERACNDGRGARALPALQKVVITVASGGARVFEDALFRAMTHPGNGRVARRRLFVAAGGRDVLLLQRDAQEADQLTFAATMLDAAQRAQQASLGAHAAVQVSVVLHQGVDGTGVYGRASHAVVVSGAWLEDGYRGHRAVLLALMNDLREGDTSVYHQMRSILMEMLCSDSDNAARGEWRMLATQCACVALTDRGEPAEGAGHMTAVLAMLIAVNNDLAWTLRRWPRACALAGQINELRLRGCDLRSLEHDPYLLLPRTAAAGAVVGLLHALLAAVSALFPGPPYGGTCRAGGGRPGDGSMAQALWRSAGPHRS